MEDRLLGDPKRFVFWRRSHGRDAHVTLKASMHSSTRLLSLDAFRGLTMAAMVLANNPGNSHTYAPLEHAQWHGWTMTDLIFPFFLFIVGVATPFSQAARPARGDSKGPLALGVVSPA